MAKRKLGNIILLICAVLAVAVILTTGVVLAKYTTERGGNHSVTSNEFYFESNKLKEGGIIYDINSDVTAIEFELYNFKDALRVSELDSTYTISVTCDEGGDTDFDLDRTTHNASAMSSDTLTVKLSGLEPGNTYTVTAVSEAKYQKTLSATFKVKDVPKKIYKNVLVDPEGFLTLTVKVENLTGTLTVEFPAGLAPDPFNDAMSGIHNYVDGEYKEADFNDTFDVGDDPTRKYKFFIDGYTGGDFIVTLTDSNGDVYTAEDFSIS